MCPLKGLLDPNIILCVGLPFCCFARKTLFVGSLLCGACFDTARSGLATRDHNSAQVAWGCTNAVNMVCHLSILVDDGENSCTAAC
jgi:hypothetical protein